MKKLLFATLLSIATVAFSGCVENANKQQPTTAPQDTASTESQAQSPTKQSLQVSLASGGRTLDPAAATDGGSAIFVNAAYDQLVTFGTIEKDGNLIANPDDIQPLLAKSWTVSEDGRTYTLTLDERATFANGDPVNADAVVYSLERIKNSNTSSFLFALSNIDTIEKTDDHTVVLQLSKPNTIIFKLLQMHIFSIVNPKQLEGVENVDDYLKLNTVGSGAFVIDKWEPTTEIILSANPNYWRSKAAMDTVTVSIIPESSSRVLLMDKGDSDMTTNIPAKDLPLLAQNTNLNVITYDSNEIGYLAMNTEKTPFDDLKVRQAINYAIPYDAILKDVLSGKAKRLNHVIPSAMPSSFNEPSIYSYDLEKAKALLKEAGFENGFTTTMTVSNGKQEWMDIAVLLQSELAKIGITVNIEKLERPQYLEAMKGKTIDMAIGTYTAFVNDPGYFFGNTLHSKGEYNYANFKNAQVDALWEQAENETDVQKRNDLYKEAQKIVEQEAPWGNLFENESTVISNKKIKNFVYFPDGALRFYSITF